jgi:anionic cell wall polymer biosynthesis LytR-Cps2A-Psr (LCP) family protein
MARQQCLITALAEQLDAKQVLSAYPKIAKALRGDLQTSIAAAALPRWAALAAKVRETPIQRVRLGTGGGTADPDFAEIRQQVEQALSATAPSPTGTGPTSGKGGQPASANWMAGSTC